MDTGWSEQPLPFLGKRQNKVADQVRVRPVSQEGTGEAGEGCRKGLPFRVSGQVRLVEELT